MGNPWFKFKQFEIMQDQSAMKVGTDSVILGAWTEVKSASKALDIGTGTGLLALMLAQRSSQLLIDAIEIEEKSAIQAGSNCMESRFSSQIVIHNISFYNFLLGAEKPRYDLIICNPPYFSQSLKAHSTARSFARHDDSLTLSDLFKGVSALLLPQGRFNLIIPVGNYESTMELAGVHGLFLSRIMQIKPSPEKEGIRFCLEFAFNRQEIEDKTLVIEAGKRHDYSEEYIKLTRDFYLNM